LTAPSPGELVPAEFLVLDERFAGTGGDRWLERAFRGGRWLEGPAYSPAGRFLLFSDIPNDRVLRYDEISGRTDVFCQPADFPNGRTVDREGRFVSCEHGARRVTRREHDGSVRVLADGYLGRRLNSPNDVVASADGAVWFTDPSYGIRNDYEGHEADEEIGGRYVYRLAPDGSLTAVVEDLTQPNGLAFSADERRLFVTDSERHEIWAYEVEGSALGGGRRFAADELGYDGIRFDARGRLWGAAHDGLHCYEPDGTLSGKLLVPEITSNLTFGGVQGNHLYLTATTSLYTLRVNFRGYPG
jgi:gluconolactonase